MAHALYSYGNGKGKLADKLMFPLEVEKGGREQVAIGHICEYNVTTSVPFGSLVTLAVWSYGLPLLNKDGTAFFNR